MMSNDFSNKHYFAGISLASGASIDTGAAVLDRDLKVITLDKLFTMEDVKFFITASSEVRAKRRYDEFMQKGMDVKYEDVLKDVKARDERDANRQDAPMKPAEDAIILDTSDLSIDEVFQKAVAIIEEKLK